MTYVAITHKDINSRCAAICSVIRYAIPGHPDFLKGSAAPVLS
jgi:hypothetical protein